MKMFWDAVVYQCNMFDPKMKENKFFLNIFEFFYFACIINNGLFIDFT